MATHSADDIVELPAIPAADAPRSLACEFPGRPGRPRRVVVNPVWGTISFLNCHIPRKFLALAAQREFTCALGELLAVSESGEAGGRALTIITPSGKAIIPEAATCYRALGATLARSGVAIPTDASYAEPYLRARPAHGSAGSGPHASPPRPARSASPTAVRPATDPADVPDLAPLPWGGRSDDQAESHSYLNARPDPSLLGPDPSD